MKSRYLKKQYYSKKREKDMNVLVRYVSILRGVKSACKDPSFAQSLVIFAHFMWQLPEWPF